MVHTQIYIIKLGGSIISPTVEHFDWEYLKRLKELFSKMIAERKEFVVIAGGGKICRWYQNEARSVGVQNNEDLDWIGTYVTRVNAEAINSFFKPLSDDRAYCEFDKPVNFTNSILVVGGWQPGMSTNMDSVLMAEKFKSDTIINLSDINYVYDKDPRTNPDAVPLKELSWQRYEQVIADKIGPERVHQAGDNLPFDVVATAKAKELGLKVVFMNGHNLENLENYLTEKPFDGSVIS